VNYFQLQHRELRHQFTKYRNSEYATSESDTRSNPEVVSETVNLVHPLMQDGHDADVAICKQLPIDKMLLIAADIAIHAELRRDRTPGKAVFRYGGETREQAAYIAFGLRAPQVSRV
jgi:hypothetical protein